MFHRKLKTTVLLLVFLALIADSNSAALFGLEGVNTALKAIVPSLFPFLTLSALLNSYLAGNTGLLLKKLGRLFRVPSGTEPILISAFLGGYPAGAAAISEYYQKGCLTKEEAKQLLCFCNNPGPAFIFGIVGTLFDRPVELWILWLIQILSALLVSRLSIHRQEKSGRKVLHHSSITLKQAMVQSMHNIAYICGWVILFRVLSGMICHWILWFMPEYVQITVCGFLELSSGCLMLSRLSDPVSRFVLCALLLTCGGLCVTMQTASIVGELGTGRYMIYKLLQTSVSIILASAWGYMMEPDNRLHVHFSWILSLIAVGILATFFIAKRSSFSKNHAI